MIKQHNNVAGANSNSRLQKMGKSNSLW